MRKKGIWNSVVVDLLFIFLPLWDSLIVLCFLVRYFVSILVLQSRGLVALLSLSSLVSRDCCVALPSGATGLFAVYDCGTSIS